jgi:hypothetical protein
MEDSELLYELETADLFTVVLTLSIHLHYCQGGPRRSNLSSRLERTRISCYAALTNARVCGFP